MVGLIDFAENILSQVFKSQSEVKKNYRKFVNIYFPK